MSVTILTSTKDMTNEKWHECRRKGIGGSDAAAVCGVNKYKSPVELWMEKTGQLVPEEAGEAAYWGSKFETLIRDEFFKRTGIKVVQVNDLLQSREYPFMLANLDGVCKCPDYGTCIFEAKTASAYKSVEWEGKSVPQEYILQVQHYMAVTGYSGAWIAVLIGGNTFHWTFVERDEELISRLIKWEGDFWEHVQSDIPPNLDGSEASAKYLNRRYPSGIGHSKIKLPQTAAELILRYDAANEMVNHHLAVKQEAENKLKEMLGENEIGVIGDRVITWKNVTQERLDSKMLKSEQPVLYERYSNSTSYRRFTVKTAG